MTLRLFDSGTSSLCTFAPLRPGRVGIYLCGPTVQAPPHVGHLRSAVVFDQLRRWLQIGHELDVTLVRNITDLDDKILAASNTAGVPWWAWAARQERAFADAYRMIGILPPTIEPRATGHTAEMLTFHRPADRPGPRVPSGRGSGGRLLRRLIMARLRVSDLTGARHSPRRRTYRSGNRET